MFAPFRRVINAPSARLVAQLRHASAATRPPSLGVTRNLSSDSPIRRPKAVKIKKSKARRRVEHRESAQDPVENQQSPIEQSQGTEPFGGQKNYSAFWVVGTAVALISVGVIFGKREEKRDDYWQEHDEFRGWMRWNEKRNAQDGGSRRP